ncbi:hypothetical protein [Sphingomonas adhaesiva]|uniref:hypothetical protein n=1 Tax=Sphingomonas adhaesiva TaxID=28212 RepID=UPI002FFA1796
MTRVRIRPGARRVMEMLAIFAALGAFAAVLTHGHGFAGIQPHPLWVPVIAMALAYGTGAGVVAATLASAWWLVEAQGLMERGDYLDRLLHVSLPPLMWFVAAAVIGEVTLTRTRRHDRQARKLAAARHDLARLGGAIEELTRTNRALQVHIATDERTTGHVIAAAARLAAPDEATRRAALAELVARAAGTTDFTCYLVAPDRSAHPWLTGTTDARRPPALSEALVGVIANRREVLHVARRRDRTPLDTIGVAAVPLYHAGGGEMVGCLVLHDIPFAAFRAQALAELNRIGHWLAPLASAAQRGGDVRATGRVA